VENKFGKNKSPDDLKRIEDEERKKHEFEI
jgi:hypothetical protein